MKVYELKKFLTEKINKEGLKRPIKVSNGGIEHYLYAKVFTSDDTGCEYPLYLIFTREYTYLTGEELLKIVKTVPDDYNNQDIQIEVEDYNPTKKDFDVEFMTTYHSVDILESNVMVAEICVRLLERILMVF